PMKKALMRNSATVARPTAASSVLPIQPTKRVSATSIAVKESMDRTSGQASWATWRTSPGWRFFILVMILTRGRAQDESGTFDRGKVWYGKQRMTKSQVEVAC